MSAGHVTSISNFLPLNLPSPSLPKPVSLPYLSTELLLVQLFSMKFGVTVTSEFSISPLLMQSIAKCYMELLLRNLSQVCPLLIISSRATLVQITVISYLNSGNSSSLLSPLIIIALFNLVSSIIQKNCPQA